MPHVMTEAVIRISRWSSAGLRPLLQIDLRPKTLVMGNKRADREGVKPSPTRFLFRWRINAGGLPGADRARDPWRSQRVHPRREPTGRCGSRWCVLGSNRSGARRNFLNFVGTTRLSRRLSSPFPWESKNVSNVSPGTAWVSKGGIEPTTRDTLDGVEIEIPIPYRNALLLFKKHVMVLM